MRLDLGSRRPVCCMRSAKASRQGARAKRRLLEPHEMPRDVQRSVIIFSLPPAPVLAFAATATESQSMTKFVSMRSLRESTHTA